MGTRMPTHADHDEAAPEGSASVGFPRTRPNGDRAVAGRTEVVVDLAYDPPGGAVGATLAKLFREEPGQQVQDDLRRLKQVMETGEVVLSDASVHRGPHPARPSRQPSRPAWRRPTREPSAEAAP